MNIFDVLGTLYYTFDFKNPLKHYKYSRIFFVFLLTLLTNGAITSVMFFWINGNEKKQTNWKKDIDRKFK